MFLKDNYIEIKKFFRKYLDRTGVYRVTCSYVIMGYIIVGIILKITLIGSELILGK